MNKELQEGRIVDLGDVAIAPTDIEGNIKKTTDMISKALSKNALLVVLGGDHSISYPVLKAYDQRGKDFHILQFDAHPDYSEISPGYEYTNSHAFKHTSKMEHVKSITQWTHVCSTAKFFGCGGKTLNY